MYDAIIIGSGPNGLAAAIALAQKGLSVKVFEAAATVGGGTRTQELTLPGFHHDVCSAIHPMAVGSPFLKTLPLEQYGLEWIHPAYPLAHPLDDEPAVIMHRSLNDTIQELGADARAYHALFAPYIEHWEELAPELLSPLNSLPSHPLLMSKFGLRALRSAEGLADTWFQTKRAKALFAGLAAHSILPLDQISTSAIGLVLGIIGHKIGWPLPKGGSHKITKALAAHFESLGGEIETEAKIETLRELPQAKVILFGNTPKQILRIAGNQLPDSYAHKLRSFKYGAGVFKIDIALGGPIPWKDERCGQAGTVHLGGTLHEIVQSERQIGQGVCPQKPYVLLTQQSMFDSSRAPVGKHTVWAYCHVPNGSTQDMTEPILRQIERFAPGFRDLMLDYHTMNTSAMEAYNPNYIGGDINGGRQDITQLFTRPAGLLNPYNIPGTSMFICSSSTPPGGGVHGMCGYHAAQAALKYLGTKQG
ncbi:MAG: NAD(P)/FAD-dependent oxidoreductase [Balneolaceae bacterium]|nr:NAD(P)/FAD-dependent oxidoreductase [Balneolaceae bacterium]